jgi:glucokinase
MSSNVNILAVDIGGTSVKMGVVSAGRVLENTSIRNVFKGKSDQLMEGIKDICQDYINRYNISKVGIGCPGDICEGKVLFASNLGWVDFDLYSAFKEVFPNLEVYIDNDGHAAALAEMHYGNLKNVENGIFVTIGRGIGGAIIVNNKILYGNYQKGGKIGHMTIHYNGRKCNCGRKGCFETYGSVLGLIKSVKEENMKLDDSEKVDVEKLSGMQIVSYKNENKKAAIKGVNKWNKDIRIGLLDLCNLFDPEMIVIAGGITESGLLDIQGIKDYLSSHYYNKCDVRLAKYKGKTGLVGASLLVNK